MSLPTHAIYFDKDNNIIHKEFVNVGWVCSYEAWIYAVNKLPAIKNSTFIKLYSVKFPVSWIGINEKYLQLLFTECNLNYLKDLDGSKYFKVTYGFNWYRDYYQKSKLPKEELDKRQSDLKYKLCKALEQFLAEDLIGVQPMNSPTGRIFKLNKGVTKWQ